ncbi:MAG: archease [Thermodesulfovibrionales bacterium]|nr:archease [Thermodesulfovibrionales bacterium]
MKQFEIIDISGDVGIKAFGGSIEEVFKNSAIGMYSLITDLEGVKGDKNISISVESNSLEGLLVSWLNELIFHFDAYGFIGKKIEITALSSQPSAFIKASVSGEEFDTERHERKLLIKAATYHRLKVEEVRDIWEADIIFDI